MATHVIKYEEGNIVQKITHALRGEKCFHAIDAINNGTSWEHLTQVLEPNGSRISVSLSRPDYSYPNGATVGISLLATVDNQWVPFVDRLSQEDDDFLYLFFRVLGQWLAEGKMSGHPFSMLANGLNGIEDGLNLLRGGRITCQKINYRVFDTYWGAPAWTEPTQRVEVPVTRYRQANYAEWDF